MRRIREEAALHEALENYIEQTIGSFHGSATRESFMQKLRTFVNAEQSAGRLTLSKESPTPIGWQIRNLLHMIGISIAGFAAVAAASRCCAVLHLCASPLGENRSRRFVPTADQKHSENLSSFEDHDVTNQFSAMGSLKPGLVRLLTTSVVLKTVNYGARHITRPGRLGRIRSIHFARWVFVAGSERMIFFSNYDGSVESYMDDFINKTGFGLNASFQQWHRLSKNQLAGAGWLRRRAKVQGIPPASYVADAGLVQGLPGLDRGRSGEEHAHSSGIWDDRR